MVHATGVRPTAPPRMPGHPVLGSALDLQRSQVTTYERAMREHGDVVRMVIGPPGLRFEMYCVFHPDGVHRVLTGWRDGYAKTNRFYAEIAAALGWGLLTSEGELWERHRRLIQPLFTRKAVDGYVAPMAQEAASLADRWARVGAVDAHEDCVELSLRVLGRAIFGDDVASAGNVLRAAFPVLNGHVFRRAMSPVVIPASWPTRANRKAAAARSSLYGVADELIDRRRRAGADGEDLLSRLLRARDPESGQALSMEEVRDQALIFLLAGHETTSTGLAFTFDQLGRHPDEQELVRAEVDTVLGGRLPGPKDVPRLIHTAMAIKEALRLFPPAYATGRQLQTEDEICGHTIPAGSYVTVVPWATHRHPLFWSEPAEYRPARFAADQEAERHPHAYFPFGGGPRGCIGGHFAMAELVLTVATVVQRCRIVRDPALVGVDTNGITLRPAGAVRLQVART